MGRRRHSFLNLRVHQNLDFAKDDVCLAVVRMEKASLLKGCSHGPVGRCL